MLNINFRNILIRDLKSKNDAFEELCCQLFELYGQEQYWNGEFIRKNGAGGDGGIECYWKLKNGSEIGLQAKFFNNLDFSQINASITTALVKHPNIKQYYICAAFNKTDRKQKTSSQQDKWTNFINDWETTNPDIDFIWWGETELKLQLEKDCCYVRGIAKYFFDQNVFGIDWFAEHLTETTNKAGERYSSELNVKTETFNELLNITRNFDNVLKQRKTFTEAQKDYERITRIIDITKLPIEWDLSNKIEKIFHIIRNYLYGNISNKLEFNQNDFDEIRNHLWRSDKISNAIFPDANKDNYLDHNIREFLTHMNELSYFIKSTYLNKYILIGSAGQGKTHALCDLLRICVQKYKIPSILLLGNYLSKNGLEESILSNIKGYDDIDELFGALNSYAISKNTVALFAIDAINEWTGCKCENMLSYIKNLQNKIDKYSNIKFIISCRDVYETDIFQGNYNGYYYIRHRGFSDNSIKALTLFCDHYRIEIPSMPLTSLEFSNPLILKTLCKTFQDQKVFPKGINGISAIFYAYINYLNKVISDKLDLDTDDDRIKKFINTIGDYLYNDNKSYFDKAIIKKITADVEVNPSFWSKTILYNLEKEGFLYLSKSYCGISYQRYKDFMIAECLINDVKLLQSNNLRESLKASVTKLGRTLYDGNSTVDFLSVLIPEKFGFELIDLYKGESTRFELLYSFFKSIPQRNIESISNNTIRLMEHMKDLIKPNTSKEFFLRGYYWEAIVNCACIANHPLSSDYLHNILIDKDMADIDADWTQFISSNYSSEFDSEDTPENSFNIKTIMNPFLYLDNKKLSDTQIESAATLFLWMTSSTNNKLRRDAIHTCVNLLQHKENILLSIFNKFYMAKDLYVVESLYLVIYGVILFSNDIQKNAEIADKVYNLIFNNGIVFPNISVRDSAVGIIMRAKQIGVDISAYIDKITPPYNYPIIKESKCPDKKDLDIYGKDEMEAPYNMPYKPNKIYSSEIKSSTTAFDFNRYTMNRLQDWYNLPLSETFVVKERLSEPMKFVSTEINISKEAAEFINSIQAKRANFVSEIQKYVDYESFNYEKATNWICKKAYDFGWDIQKHGLFDWNRHSMDRGSVNTERIGKKYQWLAYREFLCNLVDNYYYKGRWGNYTSQRKFVISDMNEFRFIDPSFTIDCFNNFYSFYSDDCWLNHISYQDCFKPATEQKQEQWLTTGQDNIYKGVGFVEVEDKYGVAWIVLHKNISLHEDSENSPESQYKRDFGSNIISFIVNQSDSNKIAKLLKTKFKKGKNGFQILGDNPHISDTYLLEYPWKDDYKQEFEEHPISECEKIEHYKITADILIIYDRDRDNYYQVPQPAICEMLELHQRLDKSYVWEDSNHNIIFKNTLIDDKEHNVLIAHKDNLLKLLKEKNLEMLIFFNTEKRILFRDVFTNNKDLRKYPWIYHFTGYKFNDKNELTQLFSENLSDD